MNKKNRQLITKWALYSALSFVALSCFVGIGAFGISLNAQIIDKLGYVRFAAAGMDGWMIYIAGARKKQMFQWAYVAVTLFFIGAALSTIQPGAFGSISTAIVTNIPGPTENFRIFLVWLIILQL